MTPEELDGYLRSARTCRVATVGPGGAPHVSPLWFVWDGEALWLNSIIKSQRWIDIDRDARLGVVIDGGEEFFELHGVELSGTAAVVGDVPRTAEANPDVAEAELLFGDKYSGGTFYPAGRLAWLRGTPEKIVSWDYRKIGKG